MGRVHRTGPRRDNRLKGKVERYLYKDRRERFMAVRIHHEQQPVRRALRRQIERRGRWQNGMNDWGASVTKMYVLLLLVGGAGAVVLLWYFFLQIIGFLR